MILPHLPALKNWELRWNLPWLNNHSSFLFFWCIFDAVPRALPGFACSGNASGERFAMLHSRSPKTRREGTDKQLGFRDYSPTQHETTVRAGVLWRLLSSDYGLHPTCLVRYCNKNTFHLKKFGKWAWVRPNMVDPPHNCHVENAENTCLNNGVEWSLMDTEQICRMPILSIWFGSNPQQERALPSRRRSGEYSPFSKNRRRLPCVFPIANSDAISMRSHTFHLHLDHLFDLNLWACLDGEHVHLFDDHAFFSIKIWWTSISSRFSIHGDMDIFILLLMDIWTMVIAITIFHISSYEHYY